MVTRIQQSLCKLNNCIDIEHQKLCDKLESYKLSYNRQRKLLKMCLRYIECEHFDSLYYGVPVGLDDKDYLHKRIYGELYGLENYKGLKGGK